MALVIWNINDVNLPEVDQVLDDFELWPDGHIRKVYSVTCPEASRHSSGWAMRNTNNHTTSILKKSCVGVIICSAGCVLALRPAICDKARRKQCGSPCPTPNCLGELRLKPCQGHFGYPVTHMWRRDGNGRIFFQSKGIHDHNRPDLKGVREMNRKMKRDIDSTRSLNAKFSKVGNPIPMSRLHNQPQLCSCPPFECMCATRSRCVLTSASSAFHPPNVDHMRHQEIFNHPPPPPMLPPNRFPHSPSFLNSWQPSNPATLPAPYLPSRDQATPTPQCLSVYSPPLPEHPLKISPSGPQDARQHFAQWSTPQFFHHHHQQNSFQHGQHSYSWSSSSPPTPSVFRDPNQSVVRVLPKGFRIAGNCSPLPPKLHNGVPSFPHQLGYSTPTHGEFEVL